MTSTPIPATCRLRDSAGSGKRSRVFGCDVHGADAEFRGPACVEAEESVGEFRDAIRLDGDAAPMRPVGLCLGLRPRREWFEPDGAHLRVDVGLMTLEEHVGLGAIPPDGGRPRERGDEIEWIANRSEPLRRGGDRLGAHDDLHENAEGPERAGEEPRDVIARDVLDRRPTAAHDATVGGDERDLEQLVPQRPEPEAARTGQPTRHNSANGGGWITRIERALLPRLSERVRQLGEGGAGVHGRGHVGGLERDDATRNRHFGGTDDRTTDARVRA